MPSSRHFALAAAAMLAACAGTAPQPRDVELPVTPPSQWQAADPAAPTTSTATIDGEWWHAFGDAELDACVAAALEHNRDLAAAAARVEAALAQATIAGAATLPTVDAAFDAQRARRVFLGFPFGGGGVPSSTTTTYGLNLAISWELDLWGRVRSGESAAIADLQAQTADFAGAMQSLVAQTCKAYFAVIEARQQLALTESVIAALSATADDVRDRYRRGVRPALDAYQATTSLESARADRARRQQLLGSAQRQLEILMGRYPAATTGTRSVLATTLPAVPAGLPSELLTRRPDLAAAERRLAAAGCRVDAARAALYPRLSLTASGGTGSTELGDLVDDSFRVWTLGANLLQPLFRGGALRADVARNEAEVKAAVANYGSAMLRAFGEVENALAAGGELAAQCLAAANAAAAATAAAELARDRYRRGLVDFLAVQDGQQRAFAADASHIAVQRSQLDNRVDLVLALGGGFTTNAPVASNATKDP